MSKNWIFRGCVAAALLAGWVSFDLRADDDPAGDGLVEQIRKQVDTDGDGRLSAAELDRLRQVLKTRPKLPPPEVQGQIDLAQADFYKATPGPFEFKRITNIELPRKNRPALKVRVTYPSRGDKCPVIVFSHGLLGSKDGYDPLVDHWASHGYVVLQPTHGDSLDALQPGSRLALATLFNEWDDRPVDVALVLDNLPVFERELPGKLDPKRIGMGGHSFGAQTAQLVAGVKLLPGLGLRSAAKFADSRPLAFLWISPQGKSPAMRPESWSNVTRPVLAITGSKDDSPVGGQSWQDRLAAFNELPPGDKWLMFVHDGYHGFGGIAGDAMYRGSGPRNPDHLALVFSSTTAFWDAYIKDDAAARAFLNSPRFNAGAAGIGELQQRQQASDRFEPPAK